MEAALRLDPQPPRAVPAAPAGPPVRLRLATFAVPLSGNKGSASMLWGLLDALADDGIEAEVVVYSYYPARDRGLAAGRPQLEVQPGHPLDLVRLVPMLLLGRWLGRWLPAPLRRPYERLRACDVVCCIGGTTFADSMLYKVPWNLLAALPGLIAGRPVVFLAQTMGPFERPLNRALARWTLRRAAAVHGRGRRSAGLVRTLGIGEVSAWPDLSLTMRLDEAAASPRLAHWQARLAALAGVRRPVGITPNTIVQAKMQAAGTDYAALLAAVMAELHGRGYALVLLPHSFRAGSRQGHNNDHQLCQEVLRRLPPEVDCLYVAEDLTSQELRLLIGGLHLLVASRFHSMVSALAVGVPPVALGWGAQKYLEVLESFGVPELYLDYADASFQAMRALLDLVERERAPLCARIARGGEDARRQAAGLGAVLTGLAPAARRPAADLPAR
jgi:polysaccharide pyruvyl transferase WcaK-like protein